MIQKPLDALNLLKGKEVSIVLKNKTELSGKLVAFDLNTNITIEIDGLEHSIQGKNVVIISNKN